MHMFYYLLINYLKIFDTEESLRYTFLKSDFENDFESSINVETFFAFNNKNII